MEKISQNNIDEWLFEYFEGNLSKQDSEKLFFEIGNNPSYQAEFNYWKQSYLTENSPIYYPFANEIKKRFFWERKWFYYVLSAVVSVAIVYFIMDEKQEVTSQVTTKVQGKSIEKIESSEEVIRSNENTLTKEITANKIVKNIPSKKENSSVTISDPLVIMDISQPKDSAVTEITGTPVIIETTKPVENTQTTTVTETKSKKNVKKKTGTHLKLSEKITEMNSNF